MCTKHHVLSAHHAAFFATFMILKMGLLKSLTVMLELKTAVAASVLTALAVPPLSQTGFLLAFITDQEQQLSSKSLISMTKPRMQ